MPGRKAADERLTVLTSIGGLLLSGSWIKLGVVTGLADCEIGTPSYVVHLRESRGIWV